MVSEYAPETRPYWHVDVKWIAGLLLVIPLSLTLLVYGLVQITAEEPAIRTMSTAMALAFSPGGLDDESDIAQLRQLLSASPDKSIELAPGLPITVREEDIAGLSPREARLAIMRKVAEPLYNDGVEAFLAQIEDPELRAAIGDVSVLLDLSTRETHGWLLGALVVLATVSSVLSVPLVLFSYRFGRLGSLGCALSVASFPGSILFGLLRRVGSGAQAVPPPREAGMTALATYVVSHVAPPVAQVFARSYSICLAAGLGLCLFGVLGSLVWRLTQKEEPE